MKRFAATLGLGLVLVSCGGGDPVREAWAEGAAFLVRHQRADGAFASGHYGVLRAGRSTTAIAVTALARAPAEVRARHAGAIARGLRFLEAQMTASGAVIGDGTAVDYPCYTAAFTLLALAEVRPDGWEELAARIVGWLRRVQWTGARGVQPEHPAFGGFDTGIEAAPLPGGVVPGVDLSTTSWVLAGVRAAGVPAEDPLVRAALAFVQRCQQQPGNGGFVFAPTAAHRPPKAGDGITYGTATADGLRALVLCGLPPDHERVVAAREWLVQRFQVDRVPGFPADRAAFERGLRIYWLCAASRAFDLLDAAPDARAAIRAHIVALQRPDGSVVGASALMKEDDPLVATPLALLAL